MIDRKSLVRRHNVVFDAIDARSPLTVGNGSFAFTADVTGLQTLPGVYPAPGRYVEQPGTLLGTQSNWGWHSTPIDLEPSLDSAIKEYDSPHGPVRYVDLTGNTSATHLDGGSPEETWLRNNPHRLMLGQLSLDASSTGLDVIHASDLGSINQTLDLWSGLLSSAFRINGIDFEVETVACPTTDTLAVSICSSGTIPPSVELAFPYGSEAWGNSADWEHPEKHTSSLSEVPGGWQIRRTLDSTKYTATISANDSTLTRQDSHRFLLTGSSRNLTFCVNFAEATDSESTENPQKNQDFIAIRQASLQHWASHWSDGGLIDFSGSTDPRAHELERRVLLSQYLLAVNCSGAQPPQETGLMVNSWRGRFHLEMHWWHGAHFPVWGRPELLDRSMNWYLEILEAAQATARRQGFEGARWPKQVSRDGRESPSDIGPFLIWQQPHPIYLAELLWRSTGDPAVLERLAPLVFESAQFMASYVVRSDGGMTLGPPLVPAQESYGFMRDTVQNPTFELAYWSWALDVAQEWRRRLGRPEIVEWSEVSQGMVKPHIDNGVYSAISVSPFTIRQDHPSMLAALGVLPATHLIDPTVMSNTLDSVLADWDWQSTWGWDYPMIAMTAARLNRPHDAVDALFMDKGKNTYLANGHNFQTDALPIYLPGNGGLLTAVALMTAGHGDGQTNPGFPSDGTWSVTSEGILPLP
ncbi:hypothetical protein [Arthrobacter psychrolactophilus]|uniref:hypothetical protein n=1 Tax=Arthrobacter psychrolactophilus TaxID=92442 RepID=UPI0015E8854C|nr:hypothetical protein [Arthrobacter psychrolactophilus]